MTTKFSYFHAQRNKINRWLNAGMAKRHHKVASTGKIFYLTSLQMVENVILRESLSGINLTLR